MKKVRRVTEAEVIAEFLKNEFYEEEFHRDRHRFEHLVLDADLSDEDQNRLRRALLFRRRGHMWRELPPDTQWWEVELEASDLPLVRVFPRAHWRKIAKESFSLPDIVKRIRATQFGGKVGDVISKIHSLSYRLRLESDTSWVILIGVDEGLPATIIEGNHRLTAAMLGSPETLPTRFRVFFGMSPRMDEVCWYNGNLGNILRYVKNRLKHLLHAPEADVSALERPLATPAPATSFSKAEVEKVVSQPK